MKKAIVLGAGNAAFCAAIAAVEQKAEVIMLEAAPLKAMGGNSRYTAGAFRFAYKNKEQIFSLLEDHQDSRLAKTNFGRYSQEQFLQEIQEINQYKGDREKQKLLVKNSYPTIYWLQKQGLKLEPIYHRQCYEVDGVFQFWGGLILSTPEEGVGLIKMEQKIAQKKGIQIVYEARAKELLLDDQKVVGVRVLLQGKAKDFFADSIVLACGGFEANKKLRANYMGEIWASARVRGTRYNQGDGIQMAQQIGAKICGKNDGCHAVFMDYNTPDYCENVTHLERKKYRKISYPFGIMINKEGKRFVDEGADLRNYTYAKYGAKVLKQEGQFAWQIFDAQVTPLLYDEYQVPSATKISANSLEELVEKMNDTNKEQALQSIKDYNVAAANQKKFNPTIKDQKTTIGLTIPKSNWANKLIKSPFLAYKVVCGITFTYMGVATNSNQQVLHKKEKPIMGVYAAGEMVGNIFYTNYPGGSGLTSGAVFGKIAGENAAQS